MLPIIINTIESIESFQLGYASGYAEQLTHESIDIHIQLAKLAAKVLAWIGYFPIAFVMAYNIIGSLPYEWVENEVVFVTDEFGTATHYADESEVIWTFIAPIVYATLPPIRELSKFTVKQLKEICASYNLRKVGTKDELIKRIQNWERYGSMASSTYPIQQS